MQDRAADEGAVGGEGGVDVDLDVDVRRAIHCKWNQEDRGQHGCWWRSARVSTCEERDLPYHPGKTEANSTIPFASDS